MCTVTLFGERALKEMIKIKHGYKVSLNSIGLVSLGEKEGRDSRERSHFP